MKANEISEIQEYARLEGTEIGSYVNSLLELREFSQSHGMTDRFDSELDEELSHWLDRFKNETQIYTKTEPQPDITYKELEWL